VRAWLAAAEEAGALRLAPGAGSVWRGTLILRALGPERRTRVACRAKAVERVRWEQLDAVQRYAERERCRRDAVLRYFGDAAAGAPEGRCCDICDPPPDAPRRAPAPPADVTAAVVELADTAAPSVGRAGVDGILRGVESYRGRYGSHPLFGTCARLRPARIRAALDAALETGRLRQTEGRYPLVLPPARSPRHGAPTSAGGVTPGRARLRDDAPRRDDVDEELAERLRHWRRDAARDRGVPAYVVFSNRTLDEIAARRPASASELLAVPGIGRTFMERHAEALLAFLSDGR